MSYKHLQIKKPCNQKWEEMIPMATGRHCQSCNHLIHDFTDLTTAELIEMLQSNQHTCGMFDKRQMGIMYYIEDAATKAQGDKNVRKKYWNGIAAAIVAGTLQLTSAYSQNPLKKTQMYSRDQAMKTHPTDKTSGTIHQDEKRKKEKFEFQVIDGETKEPLPYAKVVMMGISGQTDAKGKISYDFEYQEDTMVTFFAELSSYRYKDEHIKLRLQNCYKRLTILYMKKEKANRRKEIILGLY